MIDPNSVDMVALIHSLRKYGDTATLIYHSGDERLDYAVIVCPKWIAEHIHAALDSMGSPTKTVSDKVIPLKGRN